ncbi:MAG: glycosyltransferase family 39 protein [Bryobacterales bacterium]|nr:glycosyltransferase family 39 protein [Bryobacteraceae bacterium]MDW8355378.1 glycosyltransferase family 39 protein [Bryobacterales bacterium]
MSRTKGTALSAAALAAVAAVVLWAFATVLPRQPYAYDEADYMWAGTRGWWANWWDEPSISLAEFVSKGLELTRKPELRPDFSRYIRATGDITFYRHYHGALYAQWIALWHAAGVKTEAGYRATGLVLHALTTAAIFWGFRKVFPALPAAAAFVAGAAFVTNRTILVTSLAITQHTLFIFLTVLTLYFAALFCRDLAPRNWYLAMATLALAFATVETTVLVLAALALMLLLQRKRIVTTFDPRERGRLLVRGLAVFMGVFLAAWPAGLLKLGLLKGYLYLAYMTLHRKTFVAGGPEELWVAKFRTAPLEFVLPAAVLVATALFWRRLAHRWEVAPFAAYAGIFLLTTLFITLSYTHYHGSLMAAFAVLTGVWFGEFWRRVGAPARAVGLVVVLAILGGMVQAHYVEAKANQGRRLVSAGVIEYLRGGAQAGAKVWYVPFTLVPILHFYRPEAELVGYDVDRSAEALAAEVAQARPPAELLCETSRCAALEVALRAYGAVRRTEIARGADGEIHSLVLERP